MNAAIDIILIFLVLTDLILLGSSRLRNAIRIVAAQGVVLGLLPLLAHDHVTWHTVLLGLASAGIKGFMFPTLLNRALRDTHARREIEPFVGFILSLLIGVGVLAISFGFGARLPLPWLAPSELLIPAGLFSVWTGLFLIIYNVSVLKGMANSFEVLMDLPYWSGVVISGVVILFYTAVGGYLAVVWTSMIQGIVMIVALSLLTFMSLQRVGGMSTLVERLSAVDPGLVATPGVWGWAGLISFTLIVSLGTWGMPQLIIRFYSIKSDRMLRLGTVVVTIGASVALLPYLSGAVARVLVPELDSADQAIPALTRLVLNDWGGALFLAGVVAAGMSTFAGVLIIIASSLVRDVWIQGLGRELLPAAELRASRLMSLAVGVVSLLIALKPPALVLVLTAFSWAVIASTNLWPLLFGVYWRRTSPRATLASMVCGVSVALLWQAWPHLPLPALPPGLAGVHGFVVGTATALLVIVLGTVLGRPAPAAAIAAAWGTAPRQDGAPPRASSRSA